jgi:hypothetical protein
MSGIEIERTLKMIDANVDSNLKSLRGEILRYIQQNESTVLSQLRSFGKVTIPTSTGDVVIPISELQVEAA